MMAVTEQYFRVTPGPSLQLNPQCFKVHKYFIMCNSTTYEFIEDIAVLRI